MKKTFLMLCSGLLVCVFSWHAQSGERIRIMALFPDKAMVSVAGTNRLLTVGKASPEGMMLIAANSRKAVIELNGRRETFPLGTHIHTSYAKPAVLEAQIWRNEAGSYKTVGAINGHTVNMLVDTGATSIAMNAPEARRLGIRFRSGGKKILVNTASGTADGYAITLGRVKVGSIELREVDAVVVDGENPPDVLLGMTFLERVTMENQGRLLTLRTQ